MRKLELNELARIEGGKVSPEFIIMCGIMSAALGTITFGLGLVSGLACVTLSH